MNKRELQAAIGVTVDGDFGAKSTAALLAAVIEGRVTVAPRVAAPVAGHTSVSVARGAWPRQGDVTAFYGPAGGPDCTAGTVALPFAFPLAWDDTQRVTRFSCHRKVSAALTAIFAESAKNYGEAEFRLLRLDQFGGCYNYRKMRNGTSLSMHSWGIAVDLDPINNQLSWGADKASFAKPAYEPFWKIVEAHGAMSLGRLRDFDFMHFEFTTI